MMCAPTTEASPSPDRSYGKVAVKSSGWSFLGSISKQASQFLVSLILARYLSPESFGLIGMVTLATGLALTVSEMGLGSAIIQKENATDVDAHSLFWFNLALGIAMALGLVLLSPLIAFFFHKPELTSLVTGASPVLLFGAISVIPAALMRKALRFRALTLIDIFCSVFSGGVAITMAVCGMGVWSLVAQALLLSLSNALLVYLCSGYQARAILSIEAACGFLPFSLNLLGFNLVNYVSRNVDYLLIGKFLGPTPLGLYTLAYKIMLVPLQNISWALGNALFPVFSKFSQDNVRLLTNYTKVIVFISAISFPGMAFVHAYAIQLITLCFNEKWLPAADVLRVLAICGMIQSVFSPCSLILLSTGRSDLQFRIGVHGVIGTIISVALGLQYGMVGVAYAYTIFNAFWFVSISRTMAQLLKCRISSFLTPLASSFLGFCVILFLANVINQFGCLNQTGKALVVSLCVPIVSGLLLFKNKILIYKNRRIRFHKNEQ